MDEVKHLLLRKLSSDIKIYQYQHQFLEFLDFQDYDTTTKPPISQWRPPVKTNAFRSRSD